MGSPNEKTQMPLFFHNRGPELFGGAFFFICVSLG
jgi:hypothetical protein